MATLRQRLGSRLLHWYPLASGCGTLANHKALSALCGTSTEEVWARTPAGQIRCSLGDYVGRAAYYIGDLDPKISWIVRQLVGPDDVALDIGANVGLVTLLLAQQVGPQGQVHAFEPNPVVATFLNQSLAVNDLKQVTLHRCGLGREPGTLPLTVPEKNAGAASFVRGDGNGRTIDVPVRTLDAIVVEEGLSEIDFIKMDVEGFEADVMKGAAQVLREIRPKAILFELNEPGIEAGKTQIVDLLQRSGYGLFSMPRCWFRVRLNRFDPGKASPPCNDFLAVPMELYEATARRVRASA